MNSVFTRDDLADLIGPEFGSKAAARDAVNSVITTLAAALSAGHSVHLNGLGRFGGMDVPERQRQNPNTREPVTVPAHRTIRFYPSKALLKRMNP